MSTNILVKEEGRRTYGAHEKAADSGKVRSRPKVSITQPAPRSKGEAMFNLEKFMVAALEESTSTAIKARKGRKPSQQHKQSGIDTKASYLTDDDEDIEACYAYSLNPHNAFVIPGTEGLTPVRSNLDSQAELSSLDEDYVPSEEDDYEWEDELHGVGLADPSQLYAHPPPAEKVYRVNYQSGKGKEVVVSALTVVG